MRFVATNPVTKKTFTMNAIDKAEFMLELIKKAPHIPGWYPHEVRMCLEEDLIEEQDEQANSTQQKLIEYIKKIINRSGGALPSDERIEKYAREIAAIYGIDVKE